jgi:parvulin-like peptidyl-prolyl isomerase
LSIEVHRLCVPRFLPSLVPRLLLVFLLIFFAFQAAAQAELIDRVVAYVGHTVITLSELNQAVAFNRALGGDRTKIREETLEGLINRHLLVQEARRLRFVEITDQDVNAEMSKLRQRLGSDKRFDSFLADVDVSREQLARMLAERLLVERFVEKKIGLFIRVSRDEAQEYFDRHPDRFKGMRFADVQKAIIAGLQEKKLEEQMEKYLAELKSKTDIRVQL